MQRLQIDPEEKLTRKEYLKRKKKQENNLKEKSKITYVMVGIFVLLSIYVCIQFYFYNKSQGFKYVAGDDVNEQKVYNVYYVTEGYTYDPVYSLNSIYSNGFEDKLVYQNSGMTDIIVGDGYIYGIKSKGLYRISKATNDIEMLVEFDVNKYTKYGDRIYFTVGNDNKLKYIDLNNKNIMDLNVSNICEILIDENNMYLVQDSKTKKILLSYDKEGQNKKVLTDSVNVSYIIQDDTNIYFVNKKDENKIYSIKKDGTNLNKVDDIMSVADDGDIKEVDGAKYMFVNDGYLYYIDIKDNNSLSKINLQTRVKEKVLSMNIEQIQNVGKTIFYKVKNEMGVYLYNYETQFMSQVTKRKIKEFRVDTKVVEKVDKQGELNKN